MTGQYQTIAEIEAEYNGEWVMIGNPTSQCPSSPVTGGEVVVHCADRLEFYRLAGEWDCTGFKGAAVQYAGRFPEEDDEVEIVEPEMARQ